MKTPIALKSQTINLSRKDRGEFTVAFHAMHHDQFAELKTVMNEFLSENELAEYAETRIDKRRHEFLTSRYLAKFASGALDPRAVVVERGCFGQPLLRDPARPDQSVSIAHSGQQTIVLIYPQWHTMGVDIESLENGSSESGKGAIHSQMTEDEIASLVSSPEDGHIQFWCLKEALSKALQCGMTGNFKILELIDVKWHSHVLEARYSQFTQYKGMSLLSDKYCLGFVMPWKTKFDLVELQSLTALLQD